MTDKDKVRLLISDVGGDAGTDFIFTDDEINTFIEMRTNLHKAAATALRTMAANQVMVQRRITFLELKTDGPAEADALRRLADKYDETADDEDVTAGVFGYARIARRFPC